MAPTPLITLDRRRNVRSVVAVIDVMPGKEALNGSGLLALVPGLLQTCSPQ